MPETLTPTVPTSPAPTPVETAVVESQPGQAVTSPADKDTAPAPASEERELSGLEMLEAASREAEELRKPKTPQASEAAKPTDSEATSTVKPPTLSEPTAEPTEADWKARAQKAEATLNDAAVQQQRVAAEQMTQKQFEDLQGRYTRLEAAREDLPNLVADAKEALEIYGPNSDQYRTAYHRAAVAQGNLEDATVRYNDLYDKYVGENQKALEAGYADFIDHTVSQFGISVKDMKKEMPGLKLNKPGDVLTTAIKLAVARVTADFQAKLDAADRKVQAAEEKALKARNKFDLTAASSRMDTVGDKTPKSGGAFDLNKDSWDYFREANEGA